METLKSYDPLAYYVNTLVDMDPRVVRAHREKDDEAIKAYLLRSGQTWMSTYA